MNKISIAIGLAALLLTACSDKPKDQETKTQAVKETTKSATETTKAKNLYGVSTQSTPQTSKTSDAKDDPFKAGTKHVAIVLETMDAANYTYAKVDEDGKIYWLAGPESKISVGSKVTYISQMVMDDFASKSLNRTFKSILFVGTLIPVDKVVSGAVATKDHNCDSCGPDAKIDTSKPIQNGSHSQPVKTDSIKVAKIAGGYSVEELYAKKAQLKDKKVKLNAKVVKVSRNIMKKDWIHLQDGTGNGSTSDIVVTATNTDVKVGDIVTTEATLKTDVDFGYGYFFSVLLEEAKFTLVK